MAKRRKLVIGLLIAGCAVLAAPSAVWRVRRHYLLEDLFGADQVRSSAAVNQFARRANRSNTQYLLAAPRTLAEYDRTARVFRAMEPKGVDELRRLAMEPWKRPPDWAPDWLGETLGRRAAGPLLATLMLGKVGPSGIPALVEIAGDPTYDSWADALGKLGEIDDIEALPALEAAIGADDQINNAVVRALARMRDPDAIEALRRISGGFRAYAAAHAAFRLATEATGPERTELLLHGLAGGDLRTAPAAAVKLIWCDDARVTPALLEALERQKRSDHAAWGLPSILVAMGKRPGTEDALSGLLQHASPDVSIPAAYALAERGDPRGMEVLTANIRNTARMQRPRYVLVDMRACDISAVGLEMYGGMKERALVDRAWAADVFRYGRGIRQQTAPATVEDAAAGYKELIAARNTANNAMLLIALERHGTPQMAADFIASGSRALAIGAAEWAWRHGKREEVKSLLPEGDCRRIVDDPALLYTTSLTGWACEVSGWE